MAGLRGTLGYYISSLVFYLGFLWMLFDEQQETWHDKIFGSQDAILAILLLMVGFAITFGNAAMGHAVMYMHKRKD